MNIYLTLDYELYFGKQHGTVENCMLRPTRELIRIGDETGARMTFFIDVGFIIRLEEAVEDHSGLQRDLDGIRNQITTLVNKGHDCQLHIHPHWEDSYYNGHSWEINTDRYKLGDFPDEEARNIILQYHAKLKALTGKKVDSFRAGGWCLQPFEKVALFFKEAGIKKDSTVFPGGYFTSQHYFYDFRSCPDKTRWHFNEALCTEDPQGPFLQVPITSLKTGPLFFWELFIRGRLNPGDHKPIGDGVPIPTPGYRKKLLSSVTLNPLSLDGWFVNQLPETIIQTEKRNAGTDVVVIGHPKACTRYSLRKLQNIIERYKNTHQFTTFATIT